MLDFSQARWAHTALKRRQEHFSWHSMSCRICILSPCLLILTHTFWPDSESHSMFSLISLVLEYPCPSVPSSSLLVSWSCLSIISMLSLWINILYKIYYTLYMLHTKKSLGSNYLGSTFPLYGNDHIINLC